jgi:prepilin-type processing-associated H-X9-DG protein
MFGDHKPNGLFFNQSVEPKPEVMRLTDIRDGAGTTLMFSENVHKNESYSWFGVHPEQCGEQHFGMVWVVWTDSNSDGPIAGDTINDQERFSQESITDFDETIPRFARPASNHPGGSFNVIFADGHGVSLEPDMSYVVYQQLMTPQGGKCIDPNDLTEPPADGGIIDKLRRAPPLTESDYL